MDKALFRSTPRLVACLLACLLSACASKPPKPEPARARLVASEQVNPDESGRSSPIVVRVYQLRADGAFAGAEFFDLYSKEKEVLGESLVAREEYVLSPGETRELEIPLNAQTSYLGVLAAFRDIRAAQWRALTRAPAKTLMDLLGKDGVTITVDKNAVALSVKD
ncbi:type VI secretion system lipoprotein TssJ [Steroidobacter sp. S1-65]|uniref:Type VI secretion system lipoprotein TssJ n=1 Tax=Steroidobacter gossypii TaxID=2805490 RepID=A0ABS1X0E0_9GAMM|nr:type VI secretion system lipoprotein TssJ [Steroidobacter gossypii]MBM0106719.1 type VI secretion system lipoprotein TssJ [Steroidobacter gossypii]